MDLRAAATGPLARRVAPGYLEEHGVLPLALDGEGSVTLAAAAEPDVTVLDELARVFQRPVRVVAAPLAEIRAALLAATPAPVPAAAPASGDDGVALGDLRALAAQAPVIQFVNVMLLDAVRAGASDVHVEPRPEGLRVRQRLDGVLRDVSTVGRAHASGVVSRIKLLAGLDIAERRLPQDGRARVTLADREMDLRVSTLPAFHGESVVIRLLDHAGGARGLGELGMPSALEARFTALARRPTGLVLATGPTGSGKTTTLYAALGLVNRPGVKLLTVEDPVEYRLPGVIQVPVNRKAGLGFANALRSMLRHDPDVIMVGEMRDRETAEIAVQAALTGHLVFSTLHTNDAAGAVTRLVDMGIEPYLVAATLEGVLAQRLVRVLCPECAEPWKPAPAALAAMPARAPTPGSQGWRRPVGCPACSGSGYRGRTGLFELLVLSDDLKAHVARGAALGELRERAAAEGLETLRDAAWRLAAAGTTSIEEVVRITSGDDR